MKKPVSWTCPVCGKTDYADSKENLAAPEHVPYRGVDIGRRTLNERTPTNDQDLAESEQRTTCRIETGDNRTQVHTSPV
jgi:hypothetical protein